MGDHSPVLIRCGWANKEPDIAYHDNEWGVPSHDDAHLFEMLILEGAQAGLSWTTILNKREGYRRAFVGFDAAAVAQFGVGDYERLLTDPGIVRNRAKIRAAINNAQRFLEVQKEFGSFDAYVWRFVDGKPILRKPHTIADIPAKTKESDELSRDLINRGFKFVGSTICYAFMQACGLVNDHTIDCFRR